MKVIFYLLFIALAGLASCHNGDLQGDATLAGTLYFKDTLVGPQDSVPVAGATLYIQYASRGTSSYLYPATTRSDGTFEFSNLNKDQSYVIFTRVDTFGILYTAQRIVSGGASNISMTLMPVDSATNGFIVLLEDPSLAPVGNFPVYGFTSETSADYNDTSRAQYPMMTNLAGYCFRFNIQSGWYYMNASGVLNNLTVSGRDSFFVPPNKVVPETLVLDTAVNGFTVTALDPQQTPVTGIPLYVYATASIAAKDTTTYYTYLLVTNAYGVTEQLNIKPGTYYINAWDTLGHVILWGKDTVQVGKTGITSNTFNLQVKSLP